jgi:hypothetical protein
MADIFTRTNDEREKAAGSKEPDPKPVPKPVKPPVDFFKAGPPLDPEVAAARAAARLRLLRSRDEPGV